MTARMRSCPRCRKPVIPGAAYCVHCGFSLKSRGPEQPSLTERLIGLLHLPYTVGCILLAILTVSSTRLTVRSLDMGQLDPVFQAWLASPILIGEFVLAQILSGLLFFSMFYLPHYMRSKVLAAEKEILPILRGGEPSFHKAFGHVSSVWPPLVIGTGSIVAFTLAVPSGASASAGSFELILDIALLVAFVVGFGTFIWVYFSSLAGLHVLGSEPLSLRPFQEDPMLGLRPLGSLTLSLSMGYFSLVILEGISAFGGASLGDIGLTVLLIGLGVIMFFLPLNRVHRLMVRERRKAQAEIRKRFSRHLLSDDSLNESNPEATLVDVTNHLARLTDALTADIALREAKALRTWPFDTQIMTGLSALLLTVAGIILARIVELRIGI